MTANAPNASACLQQNTCKPVGGYSVWGAVPPLPANSSISRPTILVVAQVDSMDFFHDAIQVNFMGVGLVMQVCKQRLLHAPES